MAKTIDMHSMRQINLFTKICKVPTKHYFIYNNALIFGVPKEKVAQAIGKDASNIKKLNQIIRKKIRVLAMPKIEDEEGIKKFVTELVDPVEINKMEIIGNKLEITATRINRATLIGRNRVREAELIKILKSAFSITELKIA
jgi:transcription antitermination factor NusA-like protein